MSSCRKVAGVISQQELGRASWWQRMTARLHLLRCSACRLHAAQIRELSAQVRKQLTEQSGDQEAIDRLEEEIRRRND